MVILFNKGKIMKKITLIALLGLSSSLLASDSGLYFGIEGGSNKVEIATKNEVHVLATNTTRSTSSSTTENETEQTFKLGYHLSANMRAYGFFQMGDIDTYGAGYDYMFGDANLKPFIGVVVGKAKLDNMDSMAYGGQAGICYAFGDRFSLEAGYKYLKTNADTSDTFSDTYLGDPATLTQKVEIKSIQNLFIGMNYRF